VIIIDEFGFSSLECCTINQRCRCSNLSLALENVKNDTEIKLMSHISLKSITVFGNISNITITGNDHTVQCKLQYVPEVLLGENIGNIVIQGVKWEKCNGIRFLNYTNASITNCIFELCDSGPALTLIGNNLIYILNSIFNANLAGVKIFTPSIIIEGCQFYYNGLNVYVLFISNFMAYNIVPATVTVTNTIFASNIGSAIICEGSLHNQIKLNLSYTTFANNTYSAANFDTCLISLLSNVTFYNNSIHSGFAGAPATGGAIQLSNSVMHIVGLVHFLRNKAADYGGAIYLYNSNMTIQQGMVSFYQNTADVGGAIYVGIQSSFNASQASYFEFVNNSAAYGGGIYILARSMLNPEYIINYYYKLLTTSSHFEGNKASKSGHYAYFDYDFNYDTCTPFNYLNLKYKDLFSTPPCSVTIFDATAKANASNSPPYVVSLLVSDLQFNAVIVDYFSNRVKQLYAAVSCIENIHLTFTSFDQHCSSYVNEFNCKISSPRMNVLNYSIDSIHNNVTLISSKHSHLNCCLNNAETFTFCVSLQSLIFKEISASTDVSVLWQHKSKNCSDIMHYIDDDNICKLVSCQHQGLISPGSTCHNDVFKVSEGYWYNNGLHSYVIFCPSEYCNYVKWNEIRFDPFPDQDLQCSGNWGGFSCGECKHGYSINYGTTSCIRSEQCLISSVPLSLFVLFVLSFFYWCLVVSFIFILLHFKLNITAGYAFGVIFYYSILEQIISVFNQVYQIIPCGISDSSEANDYYYYDCSPPSYIEIMLPLLSSIGNLKPPFMQYFKICLEKAKMIDHMFLIYFHPLIVFSIVVTIFITARRFVFVARFLGRFINSNSISLFVLLSYSSVSYTSVQMLRPLASFKFHHHDGTAHFAGWRSYWSPSVKYFHDRHAGYATIAILCEIVVGFGFPFLLLFQRYLTRHHNINFMSVRPIIDQLQACYRNECYWFSTYYLICRQVIYGVDIICDLLFGFWMHKQQYTIAKLYFLLLVCILIVVIHLWFRPYRIKSLNTLDGIILLTLLLMLISSLDLSSYIVVPAFWILPLILLVNYLSYFTKLRHALIFITACGQFAFIFFMGAPQGYDYSNSTITGGIVAIFYVLALVCFIAVHLIFMVTIIVMKCLNRKLHKPRNSEINLLADDVHNNSDEEDNSD